ncbi:hypothetical protein PSAC2689_170014 [Paraburkholderia sacchari]
MRMTHPFGQLQRVTFGCAGFDGLGADSSDMHDSAPVPMIGVERRESVAPLVR